MSGAEIPSVDMAALLDVFENQTVPAEELSILGLVSRAVSHAENIEQFIGDILFDVERSAADLACSLSGDGDTARGEDLFRMHRKIEAARHLFDRAFKAGVLVEVKP